MKIEEMSNEQLIQAYKTGSDWLKKNAQITGTNMTAEKKRYDHQLWLAGLDRIEAIETEMQKRKMQY